MEKLGFSYLPCIGLYELMELLLEDMLGGWCFYMLPPHELVKSGKSKFQAAAVVARRAAVANFISANFFVVEQIRFCA